MAHIFLNIISPDGHGVGVGVGVGVNQESGVGVGVGVGVNQESGVGVGTAPPRLRTPGRNSLARALCTPAAPIPGRFRGARAG